MCFSNMKSAPSLVEGGFRLPAQIGEHGSFTGES